MKLPRVHNLIFALVLAAGSAVVANAQQALKDGTQDIHLDIQEKRITEAPFERSLTADVGTREVRLRVGVGATAERIDVTLRGVTGDVHFRTSLAAIRERLARIVQIQDR